MKNAQRVSKVLFSPLIRSTALLLTTLLFSAISFAGVSVIVHPSNNASLDKKAIGKIFLGKKKKFPGGGQAVPIDADSAKAEFTKKVLGKSASQIKAYWSKLVFTGKGQAPKSVESDAEVIELISKNPNMIGYIDDSSVNSSVKVISKF